jgi:phospholipase/carboxylesterase
MELIDLGPLRARVLSPGGPVERVVVLLHGFGAPGDDLAALGEWIDAGETTAWVFPEAPLELGGLYGDARAWWMIDLDSIGRLDRDRSEEVPEGMAAARAQMIALLGAVRARFGDRIVLGGFSQGAMLSLDVALHDPAPLDGLVLMSGTLLARAAWQPRMVARAGLPVLQSHGRRDPLLPLRAAVTLRDLLVEAGLAVTWVEFDGGHEIPPPVLEALAGFFRREAALR